MADQMRNIGLAAHKEVVYTEHIVAVLDKTITQVGTQKTGTAGYKNFTNHNLIPPKVEIGIPLETHPSLEDFFNDISASSHHAFCLLLKQQVCDQRCVVDIFDAHVR